jgi:Fic family protein
MLLRAPLLEPPELQVLDQIDDLRRRLRFALSPARRWEGLIRTAALAKTIRGSTAVEGYTLTLDDARALAEGEQPFEADESTTTAIVGYQRAMNYIRRLSADPCFRYSSDLLRCLHYMMLEHDLETSPGRWRTGDFFVRDALRKEIVHYGPDPGEVPGLVEELMSYLNADHAVAHDVVCAAMAHLNLALIHPFSDGNGRMARALQALVLARSRVIEPAFSSIEEYLGTNRLAYKAVLAEVRGDRWNPRGDARPWIRFCLTAHYRQATTFLRRIERIGTVWDRVEQEVVKRRLPERLVLALVDATLGYRVRNATYRSAAGISEFLASRDLKALVRAGLLVPHGDRRGRFYLPVDSLKSIRAATRPKKAVEDPLPIIDSSRATG